MKICFSTQGSLTCSCHCTCTQIYFIFKTLLSFQLPVSRGWPNNKHQEWNRSSTSTYQIFRRNEETMRKNQSVSSLGKKAESLSVLLLQANEALTRDQQTGDYYLDLTINVINKCKTCTLFFLRPHYRLSFSSTGHFVSSWAILLPN